MATKKKAAKSAAKPKAVKQSTGGTPVWGERNTLHTERSPHSKG